MISSLENSRQNNAMDQPRQLVLASTSKYRRELLERLGLRFETAGPDCDESALHGEAAPETALRLSLLKARSVAPRFADALIIGSDQVASSEGRPLGKPGTPERATVACVAHRPVLARLRRREREECARFPCRRRNALRDPRIEYHPLGTRRRSSA